MFKKLKQFFNNKNLKPVSYFAHIPKTAGTSFIVLLDRFYPANLIYPKQLWREIKTIDVDQNNKYDLYRGHFGGGGVEVLTNRPIEYFTILRHPDALAQSTFHYVKREKNTKVHHIMNEDNIDFLTFLQHPMTAPLVKNRMVRNMSFDFIEDPAAQEVFLSVDTIEYLQAIIKQQKPAITDEKRLTRAINFIKNSRWFGMLERFDESLQLLCFEMNWPPIGHSQKLNTHQKKCILSKDDQDILSDLNHQDLQLYEVAEDVFDAKINHMHDALNNYRDNDHQSTDDLIDLNYQHHHAKKIDTKLQSVHYGFDEILLGSQWHRRELMQPEDEYFRWTGPQSYATIDFWLQPANYNLSIRLINATSTELLDQLIIEINGHKIEIECCDSGLVRILKLNCPVDIIKENGLVRLGFICDHMISHQNAFGSDDERLVGVAVHWIKFEHEK